VEVKHWQMQGGTLLKHREITSAPPNPCTPSCDTVLYTVARVVLLHTCWLLASTCKIDMDHHDALPRQGLHLPPSRQPSQTRSSVLITALDGLASKRGPILQTAASSMIADGPSWEYCVAQQSRHERPRDCGAAVPNALPPCDDGEHCNDIHIW
jgi:hypothetical protein